MKVVFIGNENRIEAEAGRLETYTHAKEKLIRLTVDLEQDTEQVLAEFINTPELKRKYATSVDYLTQHLKSLRDLCSRTNQRNLRKVRYAIDTFADIYARLTEKFDSIDDGIMHNLMIFTFSVAFDNIAGSVVRDLLKCKNSGGFLHEVPLGEFEQRN